MRARSQAWSLCLIFALSACHDISALQSGPPRDAGAATVARHDAAAGSDGGSARVRDAASAADGGGACTPDASTACYDGPATSEGSGACHAGVRHCTPGAGWGACDGEVTPTSQCTGRECGSDGCGGDCGACESGVQCDATTGVCLRDRAIHIVGGPFSMGSPDTEPGRGADEPAHNVTVASFDIDQTEVTNQAYLACVLASACAAPTHCDSGTPVWPGPQSFPPAKKLDPVVCVSWSMANTYCAWSKKRLCTEAEWERAAIGSSHRVYPWGDSFPVNPDKYLNCSEGYCFDGFDTTSPVGSFAKGATVDTGILDMAGNVSEWVLDYYEADFYITGTQVNPKGPCDGVSPCKTVNPLFTRVQRGGSFKSDNTLVRTSARAQRIDTSQEPFLGFRCCADAK